MSGACPNCGGPRRRNSGFCSGCYYRNRTYGDPNGGGFRRGAGHAYFDAHVMDVTDECMIWPFGKSSGYGTLGHSRAHIEACIAWHGPRPAGMEAAHLCGNRSCFNGAHLRWATRAENEADKLLHGTAGRKLTNEQAAEIRSRYVSGHSVTLGNEYGVSPVTVQKIANGTRWHRLIDCDTT